MIFITMINYYDTVVWYDKSWTANGLTVTVYITLEITYKVRTY